MKKISKKWRTWMDTFLIDGKSKISYQKLCDSEGNPLEEEDILFADENLMTGKQTLEVWGLDSRDEENFLTLDMEGVVPVFDEAGNFPIALKTKDGHLAYLKVSRKTKEVLPIHAGCCPVLSVIFVGAPSAGKTVHFLQLCDPTFHDMIARNTTCSFEDDLPSDAVRRKRYEEARADMKNKKILPEPNRKGEVILPYYFYVQHREGEETRRVLLRLDDIDGEQCTNMEWESKIFQSNIFIITIGADELLAAERGEEVQYTRVVKQLLPRLKVLRQDGEYEVRVMITKCDLLDFMNPYLEPASENSIELKGGKIRQTAHETGFDYQVFNKRSRCIQNYLRKECSNFYNNLTNAIPAEKLDFCMVASIGEECKDHRYEHFNPMFIDEPLLSILAKEGLYPVEVPPERPEEEEINSTVKSATQKFYDVIDRFKDFMGLPDEYDEFMDEDKEDDED